MPALFTSVSIRLELVERCRDQALARLGIADITHDGDQVRIGGGLDRARGGDDAVPAGPKPVHDALADTLGGTGHDHHFLDVRHCLAFLMLG
jgi:hypothetical protein